jgi:anti-sigma-K factor RskA
MSTDDHMRDDDGSLLAAEYVLGVLDGEARRAFEARLAREPALTAQVAFWEARLGGLADGVAPVTPPARAWDAIAAAVRAPSPRAAGSLWESLGFWRGLAVGTSALAAASLAALVYVAVLPAARAPLVAKLDAGGGQAGFVAAVTPSGDSLMVVPAAFAAPDQRALELWIIPPGGRPHSLGLIERGAPVRINVPKDLIAHMSADAVLAVSLEPPGGSPTGLPTGPVVANGKLARL